ncbi:hypothetical protein [Streptomyces sp. NPDC051162]|uniref:hypothetical protein n=1 Tax=unclassified Streptomyces TaxID=2593676 RepID=UPI003433F1E3
MDDAQSSAQERTNPDGTPEPGTLMLDGKSDRIGVVMETTPTRVFLRPPHGGREWETGRETVRAVTRRDTLRVGVAAVDARSRGRA